MLMNKYLLKIIKNFITSSFYNIITVFLYLFFIFFSIASTTISAQSSKKKINLFSPINRMKFANYLFSQKDYLRAFDEYRQYLKYSNNDTVRFKIGFGFEQMGRFTEAEDYFKGLFFNSNLEQKSRLEFFKSLFLSGKYKIFRKLTKNIIYMPEEYKSTIAKLKNTSYLLDNIRMPGFTNFIKVFNKNEKTPLTLFYHRKIKPGYKSPFKAALMSSIIPGLGKIYTKNYGDGITGFLFTGVLSFLAYNNFKANHQFRAWLFSGLAAIFYAGNIYGSYAAAQIFNVGIEFNFNKDVRIYLNNNNYFVPEYKFLYK